MIGWLPKPLRIELTPPEEIWNLIDTSEVEVHLCWSNAAYLINNHFLRSPDRRSRILREVIASLPEQHLQTKPHTHTSLALQTSKEFNDSQGQALIATAASAAAAPYDRDNPPTARSYWPFRGLPEIDSVGNGSGSPCQLTADDVEFFDPGYEELRNVNTLKVRYFCR